MTTTSPRPSLAPKAPTMAPTATEIAAFLAVLFFLVAGVNQVWKLIDRARGQRPLTLSPSPLEVKGADRFADHTEFHRHVVENKDEHQHIFAKLGGIERGLREEMKADTANLHEKVNKVDREVVGLRSMTEMQNKMLERIAAGGDERERNIHNRINEVLKAVSEVRGSQGMKS